MDKMILVIDDPKFCLNCPLAKSRRHNITKEERWFCGIARQDKYDYYWNPIDIDSNIKPNWCPLKEVPEKLVGNNSIYYQWGDYEDGWNHCIDSLIDE